MGEPGTRRRRRRLAWAGATLAAVIVATLTLMQVTRPYDRCHALSAAQCDRVFADFSWQLATDNDGTQLSVYDNGGNASGLAAVDNELTHGAPRTPNAAGYLEARMPEPVTRIGAIASFHADDSGAIGLLSWANSLVASRANGPDGPPPNGGMHFAATNTNWIFSVWDSATRNTVTLIEGPLSLAADGTQYAFELVRVGATVTVRLPDGTKRSASDPRIAQWSGPWACWELYEVDHTRVPATIEAIWAS